MTEENNEHKTTSPEKLLIDNPSNFQFHAAYLAYAEIYDRVTKPEAREELNQNIEALKQNQINYETFYRNIDHYRIGTTRSQYQDKVLFKTQRKRDWRVKAQKQERIRRHKK